MATIRKDLPGDSADEWYVVEWKELRQGKQSVKGKAAAAERYRQLVEDAGEDRPTPWELEANGLVDYSKDVAYGVVLAVREVLLREDKDPAERVQLALLLLGHHS